MVIVGSVIFILIVTMLHVVGKVRSKGLVAVPKTLVATGMNRLLTVLVNMQITK